MGPKKAARLYAEHHPDSKQFNVKLYGSLAATGKGHLTDRAILDVLEPVAPTEIVWQPDVVLPFHTNGMRFRALAHDGSVVDEWTAYSVGGGDVVGEGESRVSAESIYGLTKIKDIQAYCERTGKSYWEYVDETEGPEIWEYLAEVWHTMKDGVLRGIDAEGVLPGGLGVRRKAVSYYMHASGHNSSLKSRGLVYAYALAVSEENAAGGRIVTAPTCGSSGVVPAVLYHLYTSKGFSEKRILRALATAGLSATWSSTTLRSPGPRSVVREKWAWPALWPPPPLRNSSEGQWLRLNTRPRWVSNTTLG